MSSKVYYLKGLEQICESDICELLPFLSQDRLEAMYRYRFPKNRVESALAYLLFRYGLIRDYGIMRIPEIKKSEYGKPYLADHSHIFFNLSHCDKAVACGFSRSPLGVDVQHLVPYKDSLAEYFMTENERKLAVLGDKDREFTRLWTLKECYGKYLGSGICYSMSQTPVTEGNDVTGVFIKSHWLQDAYLSVCGKEEIPIAEVTFQQLKGFYLHYHASLNIETITAP